MPQRLIFPALDESGFGAYHDLYGSGTTVTRLERSFEASVTAHRFSNLLLFDRTVAGAIHHRDPLRLRRDGFDHFNLQVLRSGVMAAGVPGDERPMRPGDVVVFDTSKPQRTIVTNADYVSVAVIRDVIEAEMPNAERLHGAILPVKTAGLLSDFVLSLGRHAAMLDATLALSASLLITQMLAGISDAGGSALKVAKDGPDLSMMQRWRAEAYIDANLTKRPMQPEQIARAIGVSRSTLYRLFHPTGGVADFILDRRVARLRIALLRPSETRSLADLAHLVGFAQEAHGSRVFKAAYGLSPGRFREAARQTLAEQTTDRTPVGWAEWWRDLA